METKINYKSVVPHDEVSTAFMKYFENTLADAGFERGFEHMDPGGVDIYRYQSKEGVTVIVTRTHLSGDRDELNISSEWNGLRELVERTADAFGKDIATKIKQGRVKGCSCC